MAEGNNKILVMDDEEIVCDIASQMLRYLGYIVETVSDGREAVEIYQTQFINGTSFAAVILDLNVPAGMGGREAIKLLLTIDPNAKVVLSSGYANDPMMQNYKEYGFSSVIAKPFDLDALKVALDV